MRTRVHVYVYVYVCMRTCGYTCGYTYGYTCGWGTRVGGVHVWVGYNFGSFDCKLSHLVRVLFDKCAPFLFILPAPFGAG